MTVRSRAVRFKPSLLLAALTVLVGNVAFNLFLDWPILRISNIHIPGYVDLSSIVKSAHCFADSGVGYFSSAVPCPEYIYGRLWLVLASGIPLEAVPAIGLVLYILAALVVVGVLLVKAQSLRIYLFTAGGILFSPGLTLLFERANLDAVIFILVVLASFLYARGRPWSAFLVIVVSALLKFYTLPLLLVIAWLAKGKLNKYLLFAASFAVTIIVAKEILLGRGYPSDGFAQFGLGIGRHYLDLIGIEVSHMLASGLGFIAMLLSALWIRRKDWYHLAPSFPNENTTTPWDFAETLLVFCATIHLSCFALGLNFDYRLVFFAVAGVMYLKLHLAEHNPRQAVSLFGLALWGSAVFASQSLRYVWFGFQIVGDLALFISSSLLALTVLRAVVTPRVASEVVNYVRAILFRFNVFGVRGK